MDTSKMIQIADNAILSMDLADSEEETLNEVRVIIIYARNGVLSGISQIALNVNKSHLAFSMDSGVVGVVDLSTKAVSRMKTKHESVCMTFDWQAQSL
jgi:hypothetical protein